MKGKVTFVGAGPAEADLITLRGWRALQEADIVLHDALVDEALLTDVDAELVYVGKRCGEHSMTQEEINDVLAAEALAGRDVVRLKGGDPGVLARLGEEALHCAGLGIPFAIVPGVSSVSAAPLFSGIPLTHRGVADAFTVATAHRRKDEVSFAIPPFNPRCTVVLLMAGRSADAWRSQLLHQRYPEDLPVAFISAGGTSAQSVLVTTVGRAVEDAAAAPPAAPTMAVVGHVVSLRGDLAWFDSEQDDREEAGSRSAGEAA